MGRESCNLGSKLKSEQWKFESCSTGLTDKMRADYTIMKDLNSHTKLTPEQREERLNKFVMNIQK